jgi:hypothetical protein
MSKSRNEYELLLNELNNSKTEDDIISNIQKIVKGFSVNFYKDDLTKNPFYNSLLEDIKEEVLEDLFKIRKTILEEMDSIHNSILDDKDKKDVDKLIQLKVECQLLLIELDYKIDELKSI